MDEANLTRRVHMGFCDGDFPPGTHMCLIYTTEEERKTLIKKFIAAGFKDHDRIEYFYDEWNVAQIWDELRKIGIDVSIEKNSNQIRFRQTGQIYHPNGAFSAESMWQRLCDCYNTGLKDGFEGVRLSGEMTWSLKNIPGSEHLIEYESGINKLIVSHPMVIICQYDANRFDGVTLMEVLRVHPFMIARGRIVSNPYYEDLLKSE